MTFFRELHILDKNKLKSEIFNDKKVYNALLKFETHFNIEFLLPLSGRRNGLKLILLHGELV